MVALWGLDRDLFTKNGVFICEAAGDFRLFFTNEQTTAMPLVPDCSSYTVVVSTGNGWGRFPPSIIRQTRRRSRDYYRLSKAHVSNSFFLSIFPLGPVLPYLFRSTFLSLTKGTSTGRPTSSWDRV